MKEQHPSLPLVSYEQAKRLKAVGFDWEIGAYYEVMLMPLSIRAEGSRNEFYSAPTVALALKWMRDVKRFTCCVYYMGTWSKRFPHSWHWSFSDKKTLVKSSPKDSDYRSFEKAESALLDALIDELENREHRRKK